MIARGRPAHRRRAGARGRRRRARRRRCRRATAYAPPPYSWTRVRTSQGAGSTSTAAGAVVAAPGRCGRPRCGRPGEPVGVAAVDPHLVDAITWPVARDSGRDRARARCRGGDASPYRMSDGDRVRRPRRGRSGRGAASGRTVGRRRGSASACATSRCVLHAYNTTFRRRHRRRAARWRCGSTPTPRARPSTSPPSRPGCTPSPRDTDVRVPDPLRGARRWLGGRRSTARSGAGRCAPRSRRGSTATTSGTCDEEQARALGRRHGAGCTTTRSRSSCPVGGALPVLDTPLLRRRGPPQCATRTCRPGAPPSSTGRWPTPPRRARPSTPAGTPVVIHADLHGGQPEVAPGPARRLRRRRLRCRRARARPRDRRRSTCAAGPAGASEAALRRGVRRGPRPAGRRGRASSRALVAARQLLLANSLLSSSTAALRSEATAYLGVTVDRLRHWRATGRFTRGVPEPA